VRPVVPSRCDRRRSTSPCRVFPLFYARRSPPSMTEEEFYPRPKHGRPRGARRLFLFFLPPHGLPLCGIEGCSSFPRYEGAPARPPEEPPSFPKMAQDLLSSTSSFFSRGSFLFRSARSFRCSDPSSARRRRILSPPKPRPRLVVDPPQNPPPPPPPTPPPPTPLRA